MNKVDFASYADTRMADDNTPYVIGNGVKLRTINCKQILKSVIY